ncbi:hydroxypyruvate reductase isoform X2 [Helianthus annuus]|uniref:hydroxypyruvate reductase isoform X2 n=1 Tax=Helianthus annuus TaxID=4232 RepID=UPI00165327E8|nr:hydroxypyruvate reductase isoform X2 [Helianthus annuus]
MCDNGKANTHVLFCGPHFPASHNYTKEYLHNYLFIQVDHLPFESIPDLIGNYDICVVNSMRLNSDVIARASRMKLIMQYGVGLEGVDITAATNHGIKVARIPGKVTGNAASCAEMAIYIMLGLLRKQDEMQCSVRLKKLGDPVGDTLFGKTVFILGYGNIGIELAKRLRPFGVKILATKRNWASNDPTTLENGTHEDSVDEKGSHEDIYEFAKKSDIVVCCLTMNSQTLGMAMKPKPDGYTRNMKHLGRVYLIPTQVGTVNENFISSMRKGGLLVNIARGGLLDYKAVYEGLESGHLGGVGMDVAWMEPFDPNDPILKFPNVLLTPHVAGVTESSYRSMAKVVGDVALQLHSGKPLTGIEYAN